MSITDCTSIKTQFQRPLLLRRPLFSLSYPSRAFFASPLPKAKQMIEVCMSASPVVPGFLLLLFWAFLLSTHLILIIDIPISTSPLSARFDVSPFLLLGEGSSYTSLYLHNHKPNQQSLFTSAAAIAARCTKARNHSLFLFTQQIDMALNCLFAAHLLLHMYIVACARPPRPPTHRPTEDGCKGKKVKRGWRPQLPLLLALRRWRRGGK